MRALLRASVLASSVLLMVIVARADAPREEAPPGAPNFAMIEGVEGAPPDSAGGREFWSALRGTFTRSPLATERPAARRGEHQLSVPISNRFVLLEGSPATPNQEVYRVQLTLEWLKTPARPGAKRAAAADTLTRAFVSVLVWPPGVDPAIVRIAPASDTVTFAGARTPAGAHAKSIGRNAALLALEHLHHLSGDLAEDERLKLERAERRRAAAASPVRR